MTTDLLNALTSPEGGIVYYAISLWRAPYSIIAFFRSDISFANSIFAFFERNGYDHTKLLLPVGGSKIER
jgi:hypothetical protein